jgi:hypothetical protein
MTDWFSEARKGNLGARSETTRLMMAKTHEVLDKDLERLLRTIPGTKDGDALVIVCRPHIKPDTEQMLLEAEHHYVTWSNKRVGIAAFAGVSLILVTALAFIASWAGMRDLVSMCVLLLIPATAISASTIPSALVHLRDAAPKSWAAQQAEEQGKAIYTFPIALYADRLEFIKDGKIVTIRLDPTDVVRKNGTIVVIYRRGTETRVSLPDPLILDAAGNPTGLDPAEEISKRMACL